MTCASRVFCPEPSEKATITGVSGGRFTLVTTGGMTATSANFGLIHSFIEITKNGGMPFGMDSCKESKLTHNFTSHFQKKIHDHSVYVEVVSVDA